ncbi:RNA polymerase archaeal subunit P/eukaryotic subunit RPC10 [Macleaya cordata]|uniref:RNA polymerase archaeal subunit P/eukaryotic subunit RPC10 n=1 Tax=Macleaya cordata TaxID=56857 RepID=A0A200Q4D6_MACCD|nr:RNA polymerase archaeal subunit P/eukaryotic subunit RPC10 [Macleaya cordata]
MDPQPEPESEPKPGVSYICGDCGLENIVKQDNIIINIKKCTKCGYRTLYKKRTRKSKQF